MFLGYYINHTDGVYRLCNPKKNRIRVRRDVTWLKHMYYENVLPEPDIITGITNGDRQRDDTNGPYADNSEAVGEDIDLDDDQDDNKIIPNLVERTQGGISDDEDDNEVKGIISPIDYAKDENEGNK